jgi:flagella basal body P-ring formation protein FlgA
MTAQSAGHPQLVNEERQHAPYRMNVQLDVLTARNRLKGAQQVQRLNVQVKQHGLDTFPLETPQQQQDLVFTAAQLVKWGYHRDAH